ncbi:MAG: pro-sigmaK processing inhibitor BofA family protein [Cellulosilyticaceae bacterium]
MIGNIHPIILICIGLCMLMLICVMGKDFLLKFLGKILIGVVIILVMNRVLPETLAVGINFITMLCMGALGIPGVIMLYLVNFLIL